MNEQASATFEKKHTASGIEYHFDGGHIARWYRVPHVNTSASSGVFAGYRVYFSDGSCSGVKGYLSDAKDLAARWLSKKG